jgi:dihydrofolate synthase/folylpolyglutamate synthase
VELDLNASQIGSAALEHALAYLFARTTGAFKFGLERTNALLHALDEPHRQFPSLHIAGTNGKGSSVATAEALLRGKRLRVGKYTSPHLVDFRERIVVDGKAIPAENVVEFVNRWTPKVEELGATFFEATTALAFEYFAQQHVDIALIETGLGGRLDSTNVIDPVAAGVTTIDYDHMEYLGDSLQQIAIEKAGIYKPGRPAVVGEADPELRRLLSQQARQAGASAVRIVSEERELSDVQVDGLGTAFTLGALGDRRRLRTPLAGRHQADNVAFTLTLLDAAGPPYATSLEEAEHSLHAVHIPGRFQRVGRYVFDVAHNAESSAALAQTLLAVRPEKPVVVLFCALGDKDWRHMLELLRPVVSQFVLTAAPSAPAARAWPLVDVQRFAESASLSAITEPDFDAALALAPTLGQTVLVTGSFHTVGDAMARLQVSPLSG